MKLVDLYRGLLFLYPGDFRYQFSKEMISVFQQRAAQRRESLRFYLREFFGIAKGACMVWLAKILSLNRDRSQSEAEDVTCVPVTVAELNSQRQTAIQKMVASIARHDFLNARRYSYDEVRLKRVLRNLENEATASASITAS